jgi:hypothetical protein
MSELDDVTLDYRVAFQRYLPRRSEAALTDGYDLGRRAIVQEVSMLDLVQVHHVVLAEVLADTPREDIGRVTAAAGDFLLEVLATFDMAHRRLRTTSSE